MWPPVNMLKNDEYFAKISSLQGAGTFFAIIASPLAIFAKIANFAKMTTLQGAGTFFAIIASPLAIFPKIANFAKIASLQGATFGIQLKLSEAGDFSPFLPFSPLHAFLDINGNGGGFWWFVYIIVCFIEKVSSTNFKPYIWWQTF